VGKGVIQGILLAEKATSSLSVPGSWSSKLAGRNVYLIDGQVEEHVKIGRELGWALPGLGGRSPPWFARFPYRPWR